MVQVHIVLSAAPLRQLTPQLQQDYNYVTVVSNAALTERHGCNQQDFQNKLFFVFFPVFSCPQAPTVTSYMIW